MENYNRFSNYANDTFKWHMLHLTDEALAIIIRNGEYWDFELIRELVWRADNGINGIFKNFIDAPEWEDAIPIVREAAAALNVDIGLI